MIVPEKKALPRATPVFSPHDTQGERPLLLAPYRTEAQKASQVTAQRERKSEFHTTQKTVRKNRPQPGNEKPQLPPQRPRLCLQAQIGAVWGN